MKYRLLYTLLLCFFGSEFFAQSAYYSYISDRKFKDPTDLIGYDFRPSILEIRGEGEEELDPGSHSFGITMNNLYVDGEGIKGVYSINNINTTDFGYKLLLMNARDPTIQGHLKIVLNNRFQVDALIFKRSVKEKEMIFYQAQISEGMRGKEDEYFTNLWEHTIEDKDSLWGQMIHPFIRIHTRQNVQERLQAADSTRIEFIEKVTIIDKTKKKKKKNKNKEEEAVEELAANDPGASPTPEEHQKKEKKKIKIVKEYFVKIHSILSYDDGSTEDKEWLYPIKKIVEKEDKQAGPDEERYLLEIQLKKGGALGLYLTSKRTVSSFETEDMLYLMKGH
ncbi:MAG: hypothetical protein AAF985_04395 [Bacteroidota bacterium]